MSRTTLVYDPVAPCLTEATPTRRNLESVEGKVIGFLDNAKPNFNHLVEDLSRLLIEKHGVKSVVARRKRSAAQGVPDAMLNELDELNRFYMKQRWGDGLIVAPPTEEAVQRMLRHTRRAPDDVVATIAPGM